MNPKTRQEKISVLLSTEPKFRIKQIQEALFKDGVKNWLDVSNLPLPLRTKLHEKIPFISVRENTLNISADQSTFKALLSLEDDLEIETVLMRNSKGSFTICVSSQVGCAMRCSFCATGTLGLKRNLTVDEIVDQYRFWKLYIEKNNLGSRISNIVYMGMGEPLANYEAVKESLNTILNKTDVGITKITVSTAGVIPRMEHILNDPDWPHVRFAVSLHSANPYVRNKLMPSSYEDFLLRLASWGKQYLEAFGNRNHHLTFEYIMLNSINDSKKDALELIQYVKSIGDVKVNLIPYNFTDFLFMPSTEEVMDAFQQTLKNNGVTVTKRRSRGDDIAAACGQLAKKKC